MLPTFSQSWARLSADSCCLRPAEGAAARQRGTTSCEPQNPPAECSENGDDLGATLRAIASTAMLLENSQSSEPPGGDSPTARSLMQYPDGRSYPSELCFRDGDRPLAEWSREKFDPKADWPVACILDERLVHQGRGRKRRVQYLVKWQSALKNCRALTEWRAQQRHIRKEQQSSSHSATKPRVQ
ncbi:hypothetical protein WJX72_010585 [[Myrmecia] bisecta]|uniref:Uncharacterized protein n=1 Tax=[Myrmecia] bisecta TaxID=41462 RepID=A0AAW1RA60_9CHLO